MEWSGKKSMYMTHPLAENSSNLLCSSISNYTNVKMLKCDYCSILNVPNHLSPYSHHYNCCINKYCVICNIVDKVAIEGYHGRNFIYFLLRVNFFTRLKFPGGRYFLRPLVLGRFFFFFFNWEGILQTTVHKVKDLC